MDAVLATIVNGGWAILLKTQRLIGKNYFSFILGVTTVFFLAATSAVLIHQIHAA
jgi:hypothetical protein